MKAKTSGLAYRLPGPLRRHILHFEALIYDAVIAFAAALPDRARVLDAGSGEGAYRRRFWRQSYTGIDLAVGDAAWDYSRIDVLADLQAQPFADASFDGAIHIVTLEHVREPALALAEIARVLKAGAPFLAVVPHEWEVHQSPNDYYRYTRHGMEYLLEKAGFTGLRIDPAGGYFRLLARRLLGGLQFFPLWFQPVAALLAGPPALLLPFLDGLDREKNFTLGYICFARKR